MYYIMECRYRSYTSSSHNKFLNPRFIYCTYNSIRFGENPQLQMNWLRLRNNLLKFKTAGKLPIIVEEPIEYTRFNKGKPVDVNM